MAEKNKLLEEIASANKRVDELAKLVKENEEKISVELKQAKDQAARELI